MARVHPVFYQNPLGPSGTAEACRSTHDAQLPCALIATREDAARWIQDHIAYRVGVGVECRTFRPLLLLDDMAKIVTLDRREPVPSLEHSPAPRKPGQAATDLLQRSWVKACLSNVPEHSRKFVRHQVAHTQRRLDDEIVGISVHSCQGARRTEILERLRVE